MKYPPSTVSELTSSIFEKQCNYEILVSSPHKNISGYYTMFKQVTVKQSFNT